MSERTNAADVQVIDLGGLERIELPYRIGGRNFVLREALASDVASYKDAMMAKTRIDKQTGRPAGYLNINETDFLLLSYCLFEKAGDGKERQVTRDELKGWRNSVVSQLYQKAREISGLKDEEEDPVFLGREIDRLRDKLDALNNGEGPAKNAPSDTGGTSD